MPVMYKILSLLLVVILCALLINGEAAAAQSNARGKSKERRSFHRTLEAIPNETHRRLVRLLANSVKEEFFSFHEKALGSLESATFESAELAQRLHSRIGGHVNLDDESRALTVSALEIGKTEYIAEVMTGLTPEKLLRGGRMLASASAVFWTAIFILAVSIIVVFGLINILTGGDDFLGNVDWISLDSDYLKGVPAEDFENISPCNNLPLRRTPFQNGELPKFAYLPITGGFIDYLVDQITGNDRRFLQDVANDPDVTGGFDTAIEAWTGRYVRNEDIPNSSTCIDPGASDNSCFFNAECCRDADNEKITYCKGVNRTKETPAEQKGKCVSVTKEGTDFILEPFCFMFSPDDDGFLDSIGWTPLLAWPPVNADPFVAWFLPWCYAGAVGQCKFCELTNGVEGKAIAIGPIIYQTTFQFSGFAISWAPEAKLELGAEDNLKIWDGFLNRDLVIPGINFWISFNLNVIEETTYLLMKSFCEAGFGFFSKPGVANNFARFFLTVQFEVFVGFNQYDLYTNEDGTVNQSAVDAQGDGFSQVITGGDAENLAPETDAPSAAPARRLNLDDILNQRHEEIHVNESSGRRKLHAEDPDSWRLLTDARNEFCFIMAITKMAITIPVIGGINFGRAVGGWCFLSPEDTGVQCTPNGLFFNYDSQIQLVNGFAGILGSFMRTSLTGSPTASDNQGGGLAFGVYFNQERVPQAVVFKYQPRTLEFFGLSAGSVGPTLHLQWVEGAEVERRRSTLLRKKDANGNWISNCAQIGEECVQWSPFYKDKDEYDTLSAAGESPDTEICEDILLNVNQDDDKLLYYNRMMTADPVPLEDDPEDAYRIQPKYRQWMTPVIYDFSNDPSNNIWVVYFGFRNIGNPIILLSELTISLILSNPPESTGNSEDELSVFIRLFCRVEVLSFSGIELAFIAKNYADDENTNPKTWRYIGQFSVVALGVRSNVAVSTSTTYDSRRYRHLQEIDPASYHRALASEALDKSKWEVAVDLACESQGCKAIAALVDEAAEVLAVAGEKITEFFRDDIVDFAESIAEKAKGWAEDFIESIDNFKNAAETIFKDDGLLNLMVPEERRTALVDGARSDLKADINDFADIGRKITAGATIVAIELLEGLSDFLSFFGDIYDFFSDVSKLVVPWDEARVPDFYYNNLTACEPGCSDARRDEPANENLLKEKCWCKDEFNCDVRLPQTRRCMNKFGCASFDPTSCYIRKECGSWEYVAIKITKDGRDLFPRTDGRKYDKGCREEKCILLAEFQEKQGKMQELGDIVALNWNTKIKGLFNFRPTRRRRLSGSEPLVRIGNLASSFTVDSNVDGNTQPFEIIIDMTDISKVAPDDLALSDVSATKDNGMFDPRVFIKGPNGTENDPRSETATSDFLKKRTSCTVLGDLDVCDENFLAKSGTIEPPVLTLKGNSTLKLSCADYPRISEAWEAKLRGSDQSSLRGRRDRYLQGVQLIETILDRQIKDVVREKILAGSLPVEVKPGNIISDSGEDVLAEIRETGLVEECLNCLDPTDFVIRRHLRKLSVQDFDFDLQVESASPECSRFSWQISVTASDLTGTSNSVIIEAIVPYGTPAVRTGTPYAVQTRCQDTAIEVEALENETSMIQTYGADSFKPSLLLNNCPSPHISLEKMEDLSMGPGDPCNQEYETIVRTWNLASTKCSLPDDISTPFFTQNITRGGLLVDGNRATPTFETNDTEYYLPNERSATVNTSVFDFLIDKSPKAECGICEITYSHPDPFNCSEVGGNLVEIKVTNGIGVSYIQTPIATVFDTFPPNLVTQNHTVFLNKFGWLNETDVVTADDVDLASWDNCDIETKSVSPSPIYQCGDEGPQHTTLTMTDVNGNTNSSVVLITVDDSARLGIGNDRYLDLKKNTKKYEVQQLKDEFGFVSCKEIAVHVRPFGEPNFVHVPFGWDEPSNWSPPHKYYPFKPDSAIFFDALCQGLPDGLPTKRPKSTRGVLGEFCKGEVKAEVLCKLAKKSKGKFYADSVRIIGANTSDYNIFKARTESDKGNALFQTCYRAKVFAFI